MKNINREKLSQIFEGVATQFESLATSTEAIKVMPFAALAMLPFNTSVAIGFGISAAAMGGVSVIAKGVSKFIKPPMDLK